MPFELMCCSDAWVAGGAVCVLMILFLLVVTNSYQYRQGRRCYTIVSNSAGFLISEISGSSFICEILIRLSTCSMLSFTLRKGSRTVHRPLWPHSPRIVTHDVMNNGPSIAWITSKAEMAFASRASV